MSSNSQIVILDNVTQTVHVIPYDKAAFEDAIECMEVASENYDLNLLMSNLQWMEVENLTIKVH